MVDIVSGAKGAASTLKGAQAAGKELGQVVSSQQADMERSVQEAHRQRMLAKSQEERLKHAADYNAFSRFEAEKKKSDDEFTKAVPYLEKAVEYNPKDTYIKDQLKNLYYRLKMMDKFEKMK